MAVGTGDLINLGLQFLDSFAFLVLAAIGLVVIFGMMGIINLAHGEFILVGAYATTLSFLAGAPLPVAMVVGVVATTVFGLVVERAILKRFYDRPLDSMVATWAISLIMVQGSRIVFGNSLSQIGTPLGAIEYGEFSYSTYRVLLSFVSLALLAGIYVLFTRTEFGLKARATIEDPATASTMGINTERMYMVTFGFGSALAGLTGALYAPAFAMTPQLGNNFLVEAFVTVVVGGSSIVVGTSLSGMALGAINAFFTSLFSNFFGKIALLVAAMFAIRVMPNGVTGVVKELRRRRDEGEPILPSVGAVTFLLGGDEDG
jgi:branched-chain amino acid transport system permease protein